MAEFVGWSKYLFMAAENDWGVLNGTNLSYAYMPVTDYGVRFRPETRQAAVYTGLRQGKQSKLFRGMPSGQLVAPLYGWRPAGFGDSLMEIMLEWALGSPETLNQPSKTIEWAEGPNVANKRHLGLRINTATLAGSPDADEVTMTLDLMGKSESGNGSFSLQSIPNDMEKIVYVQHPDCTFTIDGVEVRPESFSLEVNNNLQSKYLNEFTPSLILPGDRVVTLQMTLAKKDDVWDAWNRTADGTEVAVVITLKGKHNGTGGSAGTTWTVATLTMPRCSFIESDTQGGKSDIIMQPLTFRVLKPDTSANDIAIVYSEAA